MLSKDKKEQLYKKELIMTVLIALLFFVMCYTVFIFVLFPGLKGGDILGLPIHYATNLIFGWFGMTLATYIYTVLANKFDEEMEEVTAELSEGSDEPPGVEGGK